MCLPFLALARLRSSERDAPPLVSARARKRRKKVPLVYLPHTAQHPHVQSGHVELQGHRGGEGRGLFTVPLQWKRGRGECAYRAAQWMTLSPHESVRSSRAPCSSKRAAMDRSSFLTASMRAVTPEYALSRRFTSQLHTQAKTPHRVNLGSSCPVAWAGHRASKQE